MLNPSQRAAVEASAPRVVVRAGPGSGKTRVLVERARRDIREGGRPVLLTFTRSAAREMLERLGDDAGGAEYVGTLHGLCARILAACPDHLPPGVRPDGWTVASEQSQRVARDVAGREADAARRVAGLVTYGEVFDGALAAVEAGAWRVDGLLLVDEAQDLTPREWRLVRALSPRRLCVGDRAQAIFGWRGGAPEELAVEAANARTFDLATNYRSGSEVVRVANALPVVGRVMVEAARDEPGAVSLVPPPVAVEGLRGVRGGAVLARTRRQVQAALGALRAAGIPARAPVLEEDCWTTEAGRVVLAALHVGANRHDSLHLAYLLRAAGVTGSQLAALEADRTRRACSLWDAVCRRTMSEPLTRALDVADAVERTSRPDELGRDVAEAVWGWDEPPEAAAAVALVREWWKAAPAHEDGCAEFLRWFADPRREPVATADPDSDVVELATIHGAKGREWRHVVVWGVEDGSIPLVRRDTDYDEERRLLYVAATRARDRLVLAADPEAEPSRFVTGLPIHEAAAVEADVPSRSTECEYHGNPQACPSCGGCRPCCVEARWSTASGDDWKDCTTGGGGAR